MSTKSSERSFTRRIDLTSLQLFVAVCELGSIGRAAEREFIAASAISKRLSDLEATLGTPLLYRHARGVDLTPAGESLLHHARSVLYSLEKMQGELKEMNTQLEGEKSKLVQMHGEITDKTAALRAEIDAIKPERETAANAVPKQARDAFDRLADRFDGEAMSPLIKPDRRREEYACSACMMDLVRDIYNKLHTRDQLVFCPSCQRILYIPDELPPETAVHRPKEKKERAGKAPPAAMNRQSSAVDVLRSVTPDAEDESAPSATTETTETTDQPQEQPSEPQT